MVAREDTQFKPGETPNPKGRTSFREMIQKVGAEVVEAEGLGKVNRTELVIRGAFEVALDRDHQAYASTMKFLAQHSEGTQSQVDNTSSDGSMTPKVTVYIPSNGRETERETETKQVDKTVDADVD